MGAIALELLWLPLLKAALHVRAEDCEEGPQKDSHRGPKYNHPHGRGLRSLVDPPTGIAAIGGIARDSLAVAMVWCRLLEICL
jgi:hypothetical protein